MAFHLQTFHRDNIGNFLHRFNHLLKTSIITGFESFVWKWHVLPNLFQLPLFSLMWRTHYITIASVHIVPQNANIQIACQRKHGAGSNSGSNSNEALNGQFALLWFPLAFLLWGKFPWVRNFITAFLRDKEDEKEGGLTPDFTQKNCSLATSQHSFGGREKWSCDFYAESSVCVCALAHFLVRTHATEHDRITKKIHCLNFALFARPAVEFIPQKKSTIWLHWFHARRSAGVQCYTKWEKLA